MSCLYHWGERRVAINWTWEKRRNVFCTTDVCFKFTICLTSGKRFKKTLLIKTVEFLSYGQNGQFSYPVKGKLELLGLRPTVKLPFSPLWWETRGCETLWKWCQDQNARNVPRVTRARKSRIGSTGLRSPRKIRAQVSKVTTGGVYECQPSFQWSHVIRIGRTGGSGI